MVFALVHPLIEQVAEPVFLAFVVATMLVAVVVIVIVVVTVFLVALSRVARMGLLRIWLLRLVLHWCCCWRWAAHAPFNDFVDLSPVEPYTTALWAVVDFYSLAVTHDQGCSVNGTLHCSSPLPLHGTHQSLRRAGDG